MKCIYCNSVSKRSLDPEKYKYGWVCGKCADERGLVRQGNAWVPRKKF